MAEEAEASQAKPAVPEELWGQKIDSLSNNGVEETTRKFCAHVRRALILYVLLLKDTGDLDALRGVVNALRGSTFGSYSDLCRSDRWLCFFICLCVQYYCCACGLCAISQHAQDCNRLRHDNPNVQTVRIILCLSGVAAVPDALGNSAEAPFIVWHHLTCCHIIKGHRYFQQ